MPFVEYYWICSAKCASYLKVLHCPFAWKYPSMPYSRRATWLFTQDSNHIKGAAVYWDAALRPTAYGQYNRRQSERYSHRRWKKNEWGRQLDPVSQRLRCFPSFGGGCCPQDGSRVEIEGFCNHGVPYSRRSRSVSPNLPAPVRLWQRNENMAGVKMEGWKGSWSGRGNQMQLPHGGYGRSGAEYGVEQGCSGGTSRRWGDGRTERQDLCRGSLLSVKYSGRTPPCVAWDAVTQHHPPSFMYHRRAV